MRFARSVSLRPDRYFGGRRGLCADVGAGPFPMQGQRHRSDVVGVLLRVGMFAVVALLFGWTGPAEALASGATRVVRYRGLSAVVPARWPVYNLSSDPTVCVRFDRHAVYLGQPSPDQRCPAHAAGRTEAILIQPLAAHAARSRAQAAAVLPAAGNPGAQPGRGSAAELAMPARDVIVTATWGRHPEILARALGRRSVASTKAVSTWPGGRPSVRARASAAASPGVVYTGPGFDACSAPSASHMSAWRSSYRAIGVYIGGTNMACSQPNLTAGWVSAESSAGWHLIPTYVGLQAPSNSCGCASIDPRRASSEGTAAASDAVAQAQSLGLGQGNPIYFDMEGYTAGGSNSSAVLAFLAAWTAQLHADGYKSGVYSSAGSGMTDLAAKMGTGYQEPDDIWFAEWNGQQTTSTSYIPSGDWSAHQRLHQYDGDHNETHGGVTMDVDGDYLDGATAAAGSAGAPPPAVPVASAPPSISGAPTQGDALTEHHGTWSGNPTAYTYQWQDCDPTGGSCAPIAGATRQSYLVGASDVAHTIRVQEVATNAAGSGGPVVSAATALVQPVPLHRPQRQSSPSIAGRPRVGQTLSATTGSWSGTAPISYAYQWQRCTPGCANVPGATQQTYTLATADTGARVWVLVNASNLAGSAHARSRKVGPVIPAGPSYWLFTAFGNVYNSAGTPWYGSPVRRVRGQTIVGMAATPDMRGYWIVTSTGIVYAYGAAAAGRPRRYAHPFTGVVASPSGGYWLYTAHGNVYPSAGAPWYGSPVRRVRGQTIVGMAATPDGKGYWLATSTGVAYAYGDAAPVPRRRYAHPITGIVASASGGYWLYTPQGHVFNSAGTPWYGSPVRRVRGQTIVGMAATPGGKGYWLVTSTGAVYAYGDAVPLPQRRRARRVMGIVS